MPHTDERHERFVDFACGTESALKVQVMDWAVRMHKESRKGKVGVGCKQFCLQSCAPVVTERSAPPPNPKNFAIATIPQNNNHHIQTRTRMHNQALSRTPHLAMQTMPQTHQWELKLLCER